MASEAVCSLSLKLHAKKCRSNMVSQATRKRPASSSRPESPLKRICTDEPIDSEPSIVCLQYQDLAAGKDLTKDVLTAYGPGGVGILFVSGVPGLAEAREALLPLSRKLALMPPDVLSQYEFDPPVIGWSRGKEKFKGKPDLAKGSFYANPIYDDAADGEDVTCIQVQRNVWPKEIPELRQAFKKMGEIIYEVAQPIVKLVDKLVADSGPDKQGELFQRTFPESKLVVARLLHYYGISEADATEEWCGWHNDNSVVTGLVPAMWLDEETGSTVPVPASGAGLYVEGRNGEQVRVKAPKDCLGFQIGEAAQILSGGVVHATPHMVRGHATPAGSPKICREAFACFIEPHWDKVLEQPTGSDFEAIFKGREQSKLIPPLRSRVQKGDTFGNFLNRSFEHYYRHNNADEDEPTTGA